MNPEEIRRGMRRAVLPIVTTALDGGMHCIGTGFIITSYKRGALMLTATHNIDAVAQIDQPYPRHHPSALFTVEPIVKRFTKTKPYALYCFTDSQAYPALIDATVGLPGIDISVCQITLGDDVPPEIEFDPRLGLDTRPVSAGDRVMVVGYSAMRSETVSVSDDRIDQAFKGRFRMLGGRVTDADPEGTGKAPCFAVDVPLQPGMSGGPVLTEDASGNAYVRGIVRSGIELSDNQESGRELVTAIWPASMLTLNLPGSEVPMDQAQTILDLIAAGKIFDAGKINERLKVTVRGGPDSFEVDSHWL